MLKGRCESKKRGNGDRKCGMEGDTVYEEELRESRTKGGT